MLKRSFPLLAAAAVLVLASCAPPESNPPGGDDAAPAPGGVASPAPDPTNVASPAAMCEYLPTGEPAKPVDPPPTSDIQTTGEVTATLEMTEGPVTFTMDAGAAPCAVNSFVSLATQGYYDDTSCHRLSDSGSLLMLQCGDPFSTAQPEAAGTGGPGYRFAEEFEESETYPPGTVAMAKTSEPSSTGSQFFLVYDESPALAGGGYTVLGTMDEESRGIVARMAAEGQDGSYPDGTGVPNNPAEISTVTIG